MNKIRFKTIPLVLSLAIFSLTACTFNFDNNKNSNSEPDNTETISEPKTQSIIGKWYFDPEDDRCYIHFKEDRTLIYQYKKLQSGLTSSHTITFGSKIGRWSYLNNEKTKFTVGWNDSIDSWYDIVSENDDKLVISPDPNNNCGFGLFGITELLKTAKKVVYTVPDEISNLIGDWYYDETKDGNYITFKIDKSCYYHYYVKNGGAESSLDGWHSLSGEWSYKAGSNKLGICMNGELAFSYDIIEFTSKRLLLRMSENNPSAQSAIYKNAYLYKK